jgi:excisionase family DNA binding protein
MTVAQDPSQLMSPSEVADWLGVSISTVYHWGQTGSGPTSFRVGKHLRYRREDVERWLADRRRPS